MNKREKQILKETMRCFRGIYLKKGIPMLARSRSAFLAFICIITGIEALSGFRYETGNIEKRFTNFIITYFPKPYHSLTKALWDFRNKMIHNFNPSGFALTHKQSHLHFTKLKDGRPILNAQDFYAAFASAANSYFAAVTSDDAIAGLMVNRLKKVHSGGALGTVPV
jgi:hypothetical protein